MKFVSDVKRMPFGSQVTLPIYINIMRAITFWFIRQKISYYKKIKKIGAKETKLYLVF